MWQSVESAVSSTEAAGILHTAMPVWEQTRISHNKSLEAEVESQRTPSAVSFNDSKQQHLLLKQDKETLVEFEHKDNIKMETGHHLLHWNGGDFLEE